MMMERILQAKKEGVSFYDNQSLSKQEIFGRIPPERKYMLSFAANLNENSTEISVFILPPPSFPSQNVGSTWD